MPSVEKKVPSVGEKVPSSAEKKDVPSSVGIKKIEAKEFDKLWRVMSMNQYDEQFRATLQNRQMGTMKYEWWKEDKQITDEELKF